MAGPLKVKVLDLTQGIAGPVATMQMGDAGATVIKVEPLEGEYSRQIGPPFVEGESALFLGLNRSKRSIALDIENPAGLQALRRMIRQVDVLAIDLRPRNVERLRLTYHDMESLNPGLVYCLLTMQGDKGPRRDQAVWELEIQGLTPYLWGLGKYGAEAVRAGADIAMTTCGMYAVQGIMAALLHKKRTGIGQQVVVSAYGALMTMSKLILGAYGAVDEWGGMWHTYPFDPPVTGYKTKDSPILFSLSFRRSAPDEQANRERFFNALGASHLAGDRRFENMGEITGMGQKAFETKPLFEELFKEKTAEELCRLINDCGGMAAPIHDYPSLFKHRQGEFLPLVAAVQHPTAGVVKGPPIPWTFSRTPGEVKLPPPLLGQHTREVLREFSFSEPEIQQLAEKKAIR